MATGPIPAAAIDRWCSREGYTAQEASDFRRCLRAMDAEYLGITKEPLTEDGMRGMLFSLGK